MTPEAGAEGGGRDARVTAAAARCSGAARQTAASARPMWQPGCPSTQTTRRASTSPTRRAIPTRCSTSIGGCSTCAGPHRRWSRGDYHALHPHSEALLRLPAPRRGDAGRPAWWCSISRTRSRRSSSTSASKQPRLLFSSQGARRPAAGPRPAHRRAVRSVRGRVALGLRGRPVVDARQRAAHQGGAVAVREAVGDAERLDALLVGQQRRPRASSRCPTGSDPARRRRRCARADPRCRGTGTARATGCRRR